MSVESKPVSAKQLRANRRNAKRSTGPRTDEGKARSAKNATTHGTFAADLLLPGEDEAELLELRHGIYVSQSPQDVLERDLVDRVVAGQWRLRRLRGAERAVLTQRAVRPSEADRRNIDRATTACRQVLTARMLENYGVDREEICAQVDAVGATPWREPDDDEAPPDMSIALANDFSYGGTGIVDRVSRYQQRIEQSVHRALRELRQLRKDRREFGETPACPYLAELDADREDDAIACAGSGVRPTEVGNPAQRRGADDGSETAGGVASATLSPHERTIVQNGPISVATSAALDAAEGCDHPLNGHARRMTPLVIRPRSIFIASRDDAGEGSD